MDDQSIEHQARAPGNWLAYGRTYSERRFSPLTQINRGNVKDLGLAWYLDLGSNRTEESTPIVVNNVMYVTTAWSRVFAIDLTRGRVLWKYDPHVPGTWARRGCCDVVNRGVAVYKGRVYVGSYDGRLIALDAKTGKEIWQKDTVIDHSRAYTITGAPRAARGKVYIGNGGAEFGVRGYLSAYDAESGKLVWRFFTVPGDPSKPPEQPAMALARKTWHGKVWWKYGGGGTPWNSIVYDPDLNQLYIGTGNGTPWPGVIRSPGDGNNLFLSSIVALDADTGKMKWYYQTTQDDSWDYDAVADIALADMTIDGKRRKVLLQAPKNGFFYVLDRRTGKLLRAHPFSKVTWASHVDLKTGRPVETPAADYHRRPKWVLPGSAGAHNWQAMSVDLGAGVVYIPTQISPLIFAVADEWKRTGKYRLVPGRWNDGLEMGRLAELFLDNSATLPKSGGVLKAFDPLTGKTKWEVKNKYYWNGGVVATKGGLVFQGDAEGFFSAYDKDNGRLLWKFNTHTSILAPPITFMVHGKQYVSVLTGGGGADLFGGLTDTASAKYGNIGRLLVFGLGGAAQLPPPHLIKRTIPKRPPEHLSVAEIGEGERLYNNYCAMCHGLFARSLGSIPDLRLSNAKITAMFDRIVLGGVLSANGMDSFRDVLSKKEVALIRGYIHARAEEDRQVDAGLKDKPRLTWLSP